jgi:hypothetical protein
MGILSRVLTPKPVKKIRRAAHPVSSAKFSAKKAVVPRGVHRALNPIEALEADAARSLRGKRAPKRNPSKKSTRGATVTYTLPVSEGEFARHFDSEAEAQAFSAALEEEDRRFHQWIAKMDGVIDACKETEGIEGYGERVAEVGRLLDEGQASYRTFAATWRPGAAHVFEG